MDFKTIAKDFFEASIGTDSFRELYNNCFNLMKVDKDNALVYHLIGSMARSYVLTYDDQPVKPESAIKSKALLEHYNSKVVLALESESDVRLRVLGEIAIEYQFDIHNF